MSSPVEFFAEMKTFLAFSDQDVANLSALSPLFAKHGAAITDRFYDVLGTFPSTAALVEGRIDMLKATHARWMGDLFCGTYDEGYLNGRLKIGQVHVKIGLDPMYVEAVMSLIRHDALAVMAREITDLGELVSKYQSLLKVLDIDLMIINYAYAEERLDRLAGFTGMKRTLIENVIRKAKR